MEIIRGLLAARERFVEVDKTVVAIGNFDGVHLGHQRVIENTCYCASEMKACSLVLTFLYHPEKMLEPGKAPPLIVSPEHKLKLIENLGVDFCIIPDFETELADLSPQEFVKNILLNILKARAICVGYDFVFGKNRAGDIELLKKFGQDFGIKILVIQPVKVKNKIVSSSIIRQMIIYGDLEEASLFLGRPVSILGTVIKGQSRGRILNYPTANIDPHHEAIPPRGVYCVRVKYRNKIYNGILNIGVCPTFKVNENKNRVEVHLFDFDQDIYGENLEIIFVKKIRAEKKFRSANELARQLQVDEDTARKILQD